MRRNIFLASGSLNRMIQAAEAAWMFKDFQAAIATFENASRIAPSNTGILLRLGGLHGLRYDYAAAERCFETAMRLAPHKNKMIIEIISHCLNFRNPEIAERFLQLALEQPGAVPQTSVMLAELYERLRRVPEAKQLVDRALAFSPDYSPALLVHARLERLDGQMESAEKTLRSFIHKPIPDTWIHAQAWYELGTILDRTGQFDEAMAAFLNAKNLLLPQADGHLAVLKKSRAQSRLIESKVSAEVLKRWCSNGPALSPARQLALLCGHARSGTTLLEQVLDAHPDIVSVEETPTILDEAYTPLTRNLPPDADMMTVLESATNPALLQSREDYFRIMDLVIGNPVAGRLLIDKNPYGNYLIPTFVRVFPEARFLVALRDPRDVVLSCFMQPMQLSAIKAAYLTLEGTVDDYATVMSLWHTLAPMMPGNFHEVRYEDMVNDLEPVARKALNFLGVSWDSRVLKFDEHARKKMVRTPTYADVTLPVYQRARGRWRNYQKYLEPHLEKLEPFVKLFGYD